MDNNNWFKNFNILDRKTGEADPKVKQGILTFRELEFLASFFLSEFFTLNHSGISGQ